MEVLRGFGKISDFQLNSEKSGFVWVGKHRMKRDTICGIEPKTNFKGTNPALKKSSNIPEIYAKMFGRFH